GYDFDNTNEVKYLGGGNANIFSGDSRVSVIGLFNNVNQQNFSFEDILGVSGSAGAASGGRRGMGQYMVRPQSGVASVDAIGINYSDTWGKRDQVSFQGSYFFNNTHTTNHSTVDRWYEAPMYKVDTLSTEGYSDTKANNHRFNARLEWKISENQNLMIRPSFSYQSNDPLSTTLGWQYGAPAAGGSGYSRTDNYSDALRHGYTVRTSAVYRAKLGKAGRTITLDADVRYTDNTNNSDSWSNMLGSQPVRPEIWNSSATYVDPETGEIRPYFDPRYLRNLAPSTSLSLRGNFTYTEPLGKFTQFSMQYRSSYTSNERDKRSYITGPDFSTDGLIPDPQLSNSYRSDYFTQSVGPGIRYAKERNT
ncbi:MAG: outer membrane beta-barrel family protein, partial [Alistipes sp.]|nr:outer membrane beta-barrel family protein [Alistipes sp.]